MTGAYCEDPSNSRRTASTSNHPHYNYSEYSVPEKLQKPKPTPSIKTQQDSTAPQENHPHPPYWLDFVGPQNLPDHTETLKRQQVIDKLQLFENYSTFYLNYHLQPDENMYMKIVGGGADTEDAPTIIFIKEESHRDTQIPNDNLPTATGHPKIYFMTPEKEEDAEILFTRSKSKISSEVMCCDYKLGNVEEVEDNHFLVIMSSAFCDFVFTMVPEEETTPKIGCCLSCHLKSSGVSSYHICLRTLPIHKTNRNGRPASTSTNKTENQEVTVLGKISYGDLIEVNLNPEHISNEQSYNPYKAVLIAAALTIFEDRFSTCCCKRRLKRITWLRRCDIV